LLLKLLITGLNLALKGSRQRRLEDPATDLLAAGRQGFHVLGIELLDARRNLAREAVGGEEFPVGVGGRGEAAGHADAGRGEAADHLPERGILAAHLLEVLHPEIFQPRYAHSVGILSL
jgi:hypothetical protein